MKNYNSVYNEDAKKSFMTPSKSFFQYTQIIEVWQLLELVFIECWESLLALGYVLYMQLCTDKTQTPQS